jgi:D-sedoheptulose 7-phosphate isomerase
MKKFESLLSYHQDLINNLMTSGVSEAVENAVSQITKALSTGLPLLVMGNGGSASDAMHIAGELVGKFLLERKALNVICLNSNTSVITAWANDYEYATIFSRQVEAHGVNGGVCWGISTSGNSTNVINAFAQAKKMGMCTIGLTGMGGGEMSMLSDILIEVPSLETPRVQEIHILIYHYICERIEIMLDSN